MKQELIAEIEQHLLRVLDNSQMEMLHRTLENCLSDYEIIEVTTKKEDKTNYVDLFIAAKRIEGCSEKSLTYYRNTIEKMLQALDKGVKRITTDDLRTFLADYQAQNGSSKVTIDNIRRILSSFFGWWIYFDG